MGILLPIVLQKCNGFNGKHLFYTVNLYFSCGTVFYTAAHDFEDKIYAKKRSMSCKNENYKLIPENCREMKW